MSNRTRPKMIYVTVNNGVSDTRVSFTLADDMVQVMTPTHGLGFYKISRFGDGETLNREWIRNFFSQTAAEIVKW